jgi:hypothetical protein
MKEDKMYGTYMREIRSEYTVSGLKAEGKTPHGRPRCRL